MSKEEIFQKSNFDLLIEYNKNGTLSSFIIESSDLAIITTTTEGLITTWNRGAEIIYGYKDVDVIAKSINVIIPFNEISEIEKITKRIAEGEDVFRYQAKRIRKDGSIVNLSIYSSAIKNELGVIIGISSIDRDISELISTHQKLVSQDEEKEKRAAELIIANKELLFQNNEKEKRANELVIANKELVFQNEEKEKRANELIIANKELAFQDKEKEKRANELIIANKELLFQNEEKEKRADELIIANRELAFQDKEKEKRAGELIIANKELLFQNEEKEKRANELIIANKELVFQNQEKYKRKIENRELEAFSNLQEKESMYARSLIEASLDPLITISTEGKITDMNEAMLRVTETQRQELKGKYFKEYFTDPKKASEIYQEVFEKGFVADYPLTIKDKNLTEVLFNGSVYKDDKHNVIGAVIVARDITEQKRNEKELTEAKVFAELATVIAEDAKIKAENAVKSKQQFLSNMSHEIRTPMNAIIGFTKVVLKTDLSTKQREYLQAIKVSGDALIVLINDILDLAKVDAGKMTFEQTPFKMEASISAMLHLFEPKIQEKNLILVKEYDATIPKVLVGDSVRLHQIILNLVSNAVKFTSEGKITVTVKLVSEDDEKVMIEFAVIDTGIGITEDKIKNIFENFQQATSETSRIYGGTGLGLAIVKQLVEPQGGTISVTSKIDEGSTFKFSLPFKKTNAKAEIEIGALEESLINENIKILVVEDIPLNQLLMRTLLDDFGFRCDIAGNGKIALEKLNQNTYDIILMDLQMPEMNGFETTEYIRNTLKLNIPIVAITADVTTVDVAKCKAVGMNDYLSKPINEELLYNKINELIKKKLNNNNNNNNTMNTPIINTESKYTNLEYLMNRTKSNPELMMEMINLYLEQTPPMILAMTKSFHDKDWDMLQATMHKILPSFAIVGIKPEFETIAKKIHEYAITKKQEDGIHDLILKLESVCLTACKELQEEYNLIKNKK